MDREGYRPILFPHPQVRFRLCLERTPSHRFAEFLVHRSVASNRQPLKSDPVEDLFEVASFRKLDWLKEGRQKLEIKGSF
jgi:hypothetical protein